MVGLTKEKDIRAVANMLHGFRRSFGCLCFDVVHAGQIDWNHAEEIEGADVENHLEVRSSDCGLPSRLKRHELQALEANLAIDSNAIRACTDHNVSEAVCDSNNSGYLTHPQQKTDMNMFTVPKGPYPFKCRL